MKVAQRFTVARPPAEVWAFFQDVPAVARCMPGAELVEDKGEGLYAGKVKARLGPFGANFEGEARVSPDPATYSGHVEGKGVDKRGGSRTRMVMDYRLHPAGEGTEVTVDADVTLAGAIAQFGRTGLIQETANILVQDFVAALERELAPAGTTSDVMAQGASIAKAQTEPPRQVPEPPRAPEATSASERGATSAATAKPRRAEPTISSEPAREIRAGSVGLRVLWAWLKSTVRGLFGWDKG
jgi:carbon monoxide dehydrogenase subunit G